MLRGRPRFRLVAPILLCALLACASGPPRPSWIDSRPPAYSDERWAVGVASGTTTQAAEQNALDALAAQTGGETSGAAVVERWPESDRQVWALAVMDRVPLRTQLAGELSSVDAELAQWLPRTEAEMPEEALDAALRALQLQAQRNTLRGRIQSLGGTLPPLDADSEKQLEKRLSEIKQALLVEVRSFEVEPRTGTVLDPLEEPRNSLAAAVTEHGLRVTGQGGWDWGAATPWIAIELRVARERLDLHARDPLVAVHWDAALEISDGEGQLTSVLKDEGRSTHTREAEAMRLAEEAAEEFATAALNEWLGARLAAPAH